MKKTKLLAIILIILTIFTVFVACSNNQDNSSTTSRKKTTKHEHEYVWTVVREATCQQTGSKEGVCSCGDKLKEPIEALPHSFGENQTKEATCMEFGSIYHECTVCHEIEEIEQLSLVEHDYTILEEGHYAFYECSECKTSFVRTVETENDLFYWTCSETAFDSSLATFNEYFGLEETSFDDYVAVNGNKVAAMGRYKDDQYCALVLYDKKAILPTTDFVLQFDVMLETLPVGGINSFLWLDKNGSGSRTLFINRSGELLYTGADWAYELGSFDRFKTGFTFEVGKWYNIALSFRVTEPITSYLPGVETTRIPYDIYIDGELVVSYDALKDGITTSEDPTKPDRHPYGPATGYFKDPANVTIRISDFGCGNGGNTCKMAFDNLRIYTGREVDTEYVKPGTYTFGTKEVIVELPTVIDWKEMNERLSEKE